VENPVIKKITICGQLFTPSTPTRKLQSSFFVGFLFVFGSALVNLTSVAHAADKCIDVVVSDGSLLNRSIEWLAKYAALKAKLQLRRGSNLSGSGVLALSELISPYLGFTPSDRLALVEDVYPGKGIEFAIAIDAPDSYAIGVVQKTNSWGLFFPLTERIAQLHQATVDSNGQAMARIRSVELTPEQIKQNSLDWLVQKSKIQNELVRGFDSQISGSMILKIARLVALDFGLTDEDRLGFAKNSPDSLSKIFRELLPGEDGTPSSYAIDVVQGLVARGILGKLIFHLEQQHKLLSN
jgi:hypothetical protein